jgi:IS5 family transposase
VGRDLAGRVAGVAGGVGALDSLLDDGVFFAPFAPYFDARIGRPSIPMET